MAVWAFHCVSASAAHAASASFAEHVDVSVGDGPFDLVIHDLNKDGHADVAVANSDSSDVSVLWGNGDGTFTDPGMTYSVGDFPIAITAGNITSGQDPDLAVANEGSQNVSILIGKGTAESFDGPTNTDPAGAPTAMVLADFNGDNRLDIATSELFDDGVTSMLGDGNATGTFRDARTASVPGSPFGIAGGDVDGDGDVDLVVAISDAGRIAVLKGNGDGSFVGLDCTVDPAPAGCFNVGLSPAGVTLGDLNGDDNPDVVVANEDSDTASVLLNDGSGGFTAGSPLDTGLFSFPEASVIADFNGDGHKDIAVVNSENDNVAVFSGVGNGTFGAATFFAVQEGGTPLAIATGDLNGDELPDIITANADLASVSVLLNETSGGCTGDCDGLGTVTVDELVKGVNIALGNSPLTECPSFDTNDDDQVTVDELVDAVNNALNGCPA
jgi:hypothetical protein